MTEDHVDPVVQPEGEAQRPPAEESAGGAPAAEVPHPGDPAKPADPPLTADLKAENAALSEELARANAAYFNLNQEYSNFVRRSKEFVPAALQQGVETVAAALLGVLDDIELARQHGDLAVPEGEAPAPLVAIAERLEQALAANFSLERFGAAGEEFDPTLHEALMDTASAEVAVATIAQVIQPGYRLGEKVLRPARVAVTSPE